MSNTPDEGTRVKRRTHLVAFCDGSYRKVVDPKRWKQSVWLHYDMRDGGVIRINLANVNYIQEMDE